MSAPLRYGVPICQDRPQTSWYAVRADRVANATTGHRAADADVSDPRMMLVQSDLTFLQRLLTAARARPVPKQSP